MSTSTNLTLLFFSLLLCFGCASHSTAELSESKEASWVVDTLSGDDNDPNFQGSSNSQNFTTGGGYGLFDTTWTPFFGSGLDPAWAHYTFVVDNPTPPEITSLELVWPSLDDSAAVVAAVYDTNTSPPTRHNLEKFSNSTFTHEDMLPYANNGRLTVIIYMYANTDTPSGDLALLSLNY